MPFFLVYAGKLLYSILWFVGFLRGMMKFIIFYYSYFNKNER